ncbi:hypothetical protein FRB97_002592 [Tulasnella sp. 331]|nr:hypothetical protein FRB97_002592 [Tulasnella sp. 331]
MTGSGALFSEGESDPVAREPRDQMIRFNASDGDASARPTESMLDRTVSNGEVNYHRKVNLNENACKTWRKKIGVALARDLNLDSTKEWYLADWPQNYELFVHLKGSKANPRHDLYLYGGPSKFRSANEFYPHARWLIINPDGKCDCKYCGNTKHQRAINFREGLGPAVVSSTAAPSTQSKVKERRPSLSAPATGPSTERPNPRAHLRRATVAAIPPERKDAPRVSRDLEADIRSKRWFRVGEVVWARLDPALRPLETTQDDEWLEWWPAVVQEARLKVETAPGITIEGGASDYQIRHTTEHRVRMLGLATQYVFRENCILPYQAHIPPPAMIDKIAAVLHGGALPQFDASSCFEPAPNPLRTSLSSYTSLQTSRVRATFEQAAPYFAFALQISGQVGMYWCATDEYPASLPSHDGATSTTMIKQMNFQGLWWGPERIWVGDLVRIKPRQTQLVGGNLLPSSPMATTRGLFLCINNFYLDDAKDTDGASFRTPMVAGRLYELADEDYIEALQDPPPVGPAAEDPKPLFQAEPALPEPPTTFKFRPITQPSFEIHFSFNVIAGRYYPGILQSPLVANVLTRENVEKTIEVSANPSAAPECPFILAVRTLLSLGGLSVGALCAIEALYWKEGRSPIFNTAWKEARQELEGFMKDTLRMKHDEVHFKPLSGAKACPMDVDMGLQSEVTAMPLGAVILGGGTTEDPIVIDDD